MFCSECGKKIDDDAKFCPECGAVTESSQLHSAKEARHSKQIKKRDSRSVKEKKANDALLKHIKRMGRTKLIATLSVIAVVLIAAIVLVIVLSKPKAKKGPGPQRVESVASLMKVVKSSSFSTYEVVYNGVCTVYNEEKPEDVDYYVAYMATIDAGFDFNEIEITKDDKTHEIIVSLPPIELNEPKVNIEDLDYIIVGKKVKTETISSDAYQKCLKDVEEKAKEEEAIYKYAKENGERLLKGLLTPFVEKMDEGYEIVFEWRESK